MIESIAPLSAVTDVDPAPHAMRPIDMGHGFADMVSQGIASVNSDLQQADHATRVLAAGGDMPVHDVMIALEQARIDMQMMVQVRNRVLAAYHDVVNMQV